jgi:hypothetical protein
VTELNTMLNKFFQMQQMMKKMGKMSKKMARMGGGLPGMLRRQPATNYDAARSNRWRLSA